MSTIKEIIEKFSKKIDYLDLELIISRVIKKPREFVMAHPEARIAPNHGSRIKNCVARRTKGEPLAYILGGKEFYGMDFKVNKNTLIPRPETELLVDEALQAIKTLKHKNKITLIDTGTGSGNIIVSIAKQLESRMMNHELRFFGVDISKKALTIARYNARKHKVDSKIEFIKGNLLEPFMQTTSHELQTDKLIIIANLPYLDAKWKNLLKSSDSAGLKYEPQTALAGGRDGLDLYRKLAEQIKLLAANCKLPITAICEIGHLQKNEMKKIFSFSKKIEFKKDLAGKWRICKITL